MPAQDKDKTHTKKRVSKACDCCRKSKTKCDGQRPCSRCLQDGKICTYMNKKKADQMYPASYVDLLETRVSILVQSLNQLLNKPKTVGMVEFQSFINDPELLNADGEFDINKVICKLLPNEKLDNLAESSEDYTLDDITHVTSSTDGGINRPKSHPSHTSSSSSLDYQSSPSPTSSINVGAASSTPSNSVSSGSAHGSYHHYSLSKVRRNSDNHIHKSKARNSSNTSLVSSFQTKFNVHSPDTYLSKSSSLDITNQNTNLNNNLINVSSPISSSSFNNNINNIKKEPNSLDSIFSPASALSPSSLTNQMSTLNDLDLDNLHFSDSNSNSTLMSPIQSFANGELNSPVGSNLLNNNIEEMLLKPSSLDATWATNDSTYVKVEDQGNMGFNWNAAPINNGVSLKFDNLFD